jgi:predicted phosphodiesterase
MEDLHISCPNCGSVNAQKHGKRGKNNNRRRLICKDCKKSYSVNVSDFEIIEESVKLAKQKQKLQDSNRIKNKTFREYARLENALASLNEELIKILKANNFSQLVQPHPIESKAAGILQISDWHLNELVDLMNNRFDFKVASQRMQMFVDVARKIFKTFNVYNILIAINGDLLNSDRRLDEKLHMSTNRMKATFLAVDLLKSLIGDLGQDFNITIACVSGNETRVNEEHGWSDLVITDNYDFTIFNILKYIFMDSPVKFIEDDPVEQVINVGGKNVLLIHGEEKILLGDVEKGVIQLCGKYSSRGIIIDYVIFGHIHYTRIGDHFTRGGSLVGANAYSDTGLQLITKASQSVHVITELGQIHSVKIDLQNAADHYPGYNFDKALEAYNPKSASKIRERKTIFEVVI